MSICDGGSGGGGGALALALGCRLGLGGGGGILEQSYKASTSLYIAFWKTVNFQLRLTTSVPELL